MVGDVDKTLYELTQAASKRNARLLELKLAMSIEYKPDWLYTFEYLKANRN